MIVLKPNNGQQTFALQQPYSISEILYGGARCEAVERPLQV